jgi:CRISPR-associated protein Cas1
VSEPSTTPKPDGRSGVDAGLELVPLRALNEYVYCPRLHHLMYVQGIFVDSPDTIEGAAQHRRAERRRPRGKRQSPSEGETHLEEASPWSQPPAQLHLGSAELELVGKLDALRIEDGSYVPVEYKRGAAPSADRPIEYAGVSLPSGAWPGDQIQVAAQVMLLEANGYPSRHGLLHYRASHTTVHVAVDDDLRRLVKLVAERARAAVQQSMPAPLVDSPKCVRCSLAPVCLPEETNALLHRIEEPRRIIPGRDDAGCLYLVTPGTRVGLSGEGLVITVPDAGDHRVLLKDVASVMVMGNIQVTTQALHALMEAGRTVTFTTRSGRLVGTASGLTTKNVTLRMVQVAVCGDRARALAIAQGIVSAKIANQRTLLRRSARVPAPVLDELAGCQEAVARTADITALMGEEGRAARTYFQHFPALLQGDPEVHGDMEGRNRRPPRDPVNALLSFGYALLAKDAMTACVAAGFDPMVGFLHVVRPGRPALALDLMEAFRPLIVDSVVVRSINTRAVTAASFQRSQAGVLLTAAGRLVFLRAYDQRMDELVTHPVFGYRMSYRRMLELEARLLGRHLEGELPAYRPLVTR